MTAASTAASTWAISSYFNPAGFRQRVLNHREFRRRLGVPLLTVELVVRVRGGHVMWQKERLLNVALRHLPAACEIVAWIDADVVFERTDWPSGLENALDRFALVQLMR